MFKKTTLTVMVLLLVVMSSSAFGAFKYKAHEDALQSMGKDVPLGQAVRMIVPQDWKVYVPDGKPVPKVSWGDQKRWQDALLDVVDESENWEVDFDPAHKRIDLVWVGPEEKLTLPPDVDEKRMAEAKPNFVLRPGLLKSQLEDIVKAHGFKLVWNLKTDIMLKSGVAMKAPFEDCLQSMVQRLRATGSRIGIQVFKKNKYVVIQGV